MKVMVQMMDKDILTLFFKYNTTFLFIQNSYIPIIYGSVMDN